MHISSLTCENTTQGSPRILTNTFPLKWREILAEATADINRSNFIGSSRASHVRSSQAFRLYGTDYFVESNTLSKRLT